MTLQNGYKVIYEIAKDGKRTFYASKSNTYPPRNEAGEIIENEMNIKLASFDDADYRNRVIYEYKGKFYASAVGETPRYNEDGTPADTCINSANFDKVFVKVTENTDEPTDDVGGGDATTNEGNGDSTDDGIAGDQGDGDVNGDGTDDGAEPTDVEGNE